MFDSLKKKFAKGLSRAFGVGYKEVIKSPLVEKWETEFKKFLSNKTQYYMRAIEKRRKTLKRHEERLQKHKQKLFDAVKEGNMEKAELHFKRILMYAVWIYQQKKAINRLQNLIRREMKGK